MSDVTDRLDALEAAAKANQLPETLAILQRKLEQNWQPDAAVLLQAGSISPAMMSGVADADGFGFTLGGVHVRWGTGTATWTASATSAVAAVSHGLTRTPAAAGAFSRDGGLYYSVQTAGRSSTSMNVVGSSTVGVLTNTFTFDWIAIG